MLSSANNQSHLLLLVSLFAATVGLFEQVMSWISILVVCSCIMRLALYFRIQKHAPSIRTLNLLAVLSGLVLAYFSWGLGILLGMVNLLVMACALKLMLLRTSRDFYQLVAAMAFLVGCGFIFQQSILYTSFYLLIIVSLLLSLAFHVSPSRGYANQLRTIGIMSLQAIPIALILFFGFPKLGPFWQMPNSNASRTGLSESVTPGDIADLSQSGELAFRATFTGAVPSPQDRYWRAIVLEEFDGATWRVAKARSDMRRRAWRFNQEFQPQVDGPYYEYDVIAEPTNQRWLFGLDVAVPSNVKTSLDIWQSRDYQLISVKPLGSNTQYSVRSYFQAPLNQSTPEFDFPLNLSVPQNGNPRTIEWAATLRAQHPDDQAFVTAVMRHFEQPAYRYTLEPALMQTDPVDQFLFDEQAGFCAHYASAMAYVLRLGGIPARMVTGYQGGEMREQDYMSVYQYDAHAWVEAWMGESGWQRFDPTAVVAPDRIRFGLEQAVALEGSFLATSRFSLAKLKSIAWLNEFRLLLADMDYFWSRWVLGFDAQSQQDLLKSLLGKLTPQRLAMFGLGTVAFVCALLALFYLPKWSGKRPNAANRYYQQSLEWLSKLNLQREPWQGPMEFAKQVEKNQGGALASSFTYLSQLYVAHQYKPQRPDSRASRSQQYLMRQQLAKIKRLVKASLSS